MTRRFLKKIPYSIFFLKIIKKTLEFFKSYLVQERFKINILYKKKKILEGKKIKVAFFVTQKQLWCSQTVYDNFLRDDLFEPIIVAFPNFEDGIINKNNTCKDNYDFFSNRKMNVIFGYDINNEHFLKLDSIDADIIFYDQPFPGLPNNLLWYEASKKSLVCYIPYGYKIAKSYEAHFNSELHNNCWIIFAESIWHKDQFKKFGRKKGENVIVSGYPKLDAYNNLNKKYKENKNKTIIWAPHWSIKDKFIGYATFDKYYNFFIRQAISNKDIFWVFKPHQRLRHYLEEIRFMTKKDVDEYYESWSSLPNCRFFNDSDYFDLFKESDALITDCGSFLAEYLPTRNPILLLVSNNSVGYNEVGNILVSTYYKAFNENDIKDFVNNVVVNGEDLLKKKRLENLNLVKPNLDGAGKFIVNCVKELLSK